MYLECFRELEDYMFSWPKEPYNESFILHFVYLFLSLVEEVEYSTQQKANIVMKFFDSMDVKIRYGK